VLGWHHSSLGATPIRRSIPKFIAGSATCAPSRARHGPSAERSARQASSQWPRMSTDKSATNGHGRTRKDADQQDRPRNHTDEHGSHSVWGRRLGERRASIRGFRDYHGFAVPRGAPADLERPPRSRLRCLLNPRNPRHPRIEFFGKSGDAATGHHNGYGSCRTRHIRPPASSATRRAPSRSTASPTGRPNTCLRSADAMNPVRKSSIGPLGRPFANGMNATR
jgi:hypothetical protein